MEEDGYLLWWQKNAIIFGLSIIGTTLGWIFQDVAMFFAFLIISTITLIVSFIQFLIERNTEEEIIKGYNEEGNHVVTYSVRKKK